MRRLILMTLFVAVAAVPAAAQKAADAAPQLIAQSSAVHSADPQASPDAMVARMMSFDRNHDGLVSRDELPERMQPLLARVEVFTTGDALDQQEIRRLAENPVAKPQVFVLQAGHYGFGDEQGFDTRLHIESAIDDLRLAAATRERAMDIGHRFADTSKAEARAELTAAVSPFLTPEQTKRLEMILDQTAKLSTGRQSAEAQQALATIQGRLEQAMKEQQLRTFASSLPVSAEQNDTIVAAIDRFQQRSRLTDADRAALLGQMRDVLSDQERDDLRAALERRPVIKQGTFTQTVVF